MAATKISALPDGGAVQATDNIPVVRSGSNNRVQVGTMASQNANGVSITGGSVSGITDLAVADGGTGASDAPTARTNLGLGTIATQASDSVNIDGGAIDGTTIGGSTPAAGTFTTATADDVVTTDVQAQGSAGVVVKNSGGTAVITAGAGAGTDVTLAGGVNVGGDLTVDTNTLFVNATTGNVGVGITSPGSPLHVYTTNPTVLELERNSTANVAIELANSEGSLFFGMDGNEDFSIGTSNNLSASSLFNVDMSTGNVGIGTNSPSTKLHIPGTSAAITVGEHSSSPSTPSTGNVALYAKTDGKLYSKDDTGAETALGGGGGGGALTYVGAFSSTTENVFSSLDSDTAYTLVLSYLDYGSGTFRIGISEDNGSSYIGSGINYAEHQILNSTISVIGNDLAYISPSSGAQGQAGIINFYTGVDGGNPFTLNGWLRSPLADALAESRLVTFSASYAADINAIKFYAASTGWAAAKAVLYKWSNS